MIRLRKLSNGNLMITSMVSEFCDCMGYCEMMIKLFLKGIKPPQTQITIEGTKAHEAKETYTVNKTEKRWFHEVKEQDEDGNWKVVHHEDKPLKDKKARKKAQHT